MINVKSKPTEKNHLLYRKILSLRSLECNVIVILSTGQLADVVITSLLQLRNQLTITVNNLQMDFDNANARLEEEAEANASLRNQLSKAQGDLGAFKSKYEKEVVLRIEEMEDLK